MKLLASDYLKSLLVLLMLCGAFSCPIQAGQPTSILGFEPAFSDRDIELPLPRSMASSRKTREIGCRILVSPSGAIDSITLEKPGDSIWLYRVIDTLRTERLQPALFVGNAVSCILPASLVFRPRSRIAELLLPLSSDGSVRIYDDLIRCLVLNDIHPPRIDSFPLYYFERPAVDSLVNVPPYLLARLELDSSGLVVDAETVSSTLPVYDRQIMNAVHWAKFAPARVHEAKVGAPLWLLFTIYSQATFPAPVWRAAEVDSLDLWERLRLRALPDTIGLMHYPIPRRTEPLTWSADGSHVSIRDTVSATLSVDTAGRGKLSWVNARDPVILSAIRRIIGGMGFWPATGFSGRPQEFEGNMRFIFNGTRTVRMELPWLPL